ncbi:hypothetical protein D3C71_1813740 [compost metagenome]
MHQRIRHLRCARSVNILQLLIRKQRPRAGREAPHMGQMDVQIADGVMNAPLPRYFHAGCHILMMHRMLLQNGNAALQQRKRKLRPFSAHHPGAQHDAGQVDIARKLL